MHYKLLNSLLSVVLLLASGCAMADPTSALPIPPQSKPVKLSQREITFIENKVCHANFNVGAATIKAYKFEASKATDTKMALPARTSAYVECESHGQFNNKPMRYVDDCDLTDGEWDCSQPQLETLVDLYGRQVKMRPWGMSPEQANEILQRLSRVGYFQGESIDKAIGHSCDVSKTKDPEVIELGCEASMAISFWCPVASTGCPRLLYLTFDKPAWLRRRHP